MRDRLIPLIIVALVLEVLWCAACVRPDEIRTLLWREAEASAALLSGPALEGAKAVEEVIEDSLSFITLPVRPVTHSTRYPGMNPATAMLPEEHAFTRALAGMLASPWCESIRLLGLLAAKRLARAVIVILAAGIPILALVADGFFRRRLAAARQHAPRPSVFSGLGNLLVPGAALTAALAFAPLALPLWIWGVIPMALGVVLASLAANWHRFH